VQETFFHASKIRKSKPKGCENTEQLSVVRRTRFPAVRQWPNACPPLPRHAEKRHSNGRRKFREMGIGKYGNYSGPAIFRGTATDKIGFGYRKSPKNGRNFPSFPANQRFIPISKTRFLLKE
jgi:hypothetical protein